ncbi:hypothetical protein BCD48_01025 [Pseudofrankia sp. BMG5.36]|nr:hypothetical protein BCD48_01025 [Pseudofrankia sp. BMG5.36]
MTQATVTQMTMAPTTVAQTTMAPTTMARAAVAGTGTRPAADGTARRRYDARARRADAGTGEGTDQR